MTSFITKLSKIPGTTYVKTRNKVCFCVSNQSKTTDLFYSCSATLFSTYNQPYKNITITAFFINRYLNVQINLLEKIGQ